MNDIRDVIYPTLGICFGVWSFFWGFKRLRRKRLIENIPTSTVRGLAMGLVELNGKAEPTTLFKSPLTKTECVLFKYSIEEYRRSGKHGSWVKVASGDNFYCPFWLNDATGNIMVYAHRAELILSVDYEFKTGFGREIPGNLIEFMNENGVRYSSWLGSRTMCFKEWFVRPGDIIYVIGSAKKTDEYNLDYNNALIKRINKLKQDQQKMKEVDLDKDGKISIEEWDIAVSKLENEVLEAAVKNTAQTNDMDVMIGKGDEESMFMISDRSERDLLLKLSKECLLGIFGGAVLSLILLGYLLVRLGIIKY